MKGKSKWQLSLTTSLLCELQKQVKVVQVLENTMRMSEESEECKIDRLGADQSNRCLDPTALRRSVGKPAFLGFSASNHGISMGFHRFSGSKWKDPVDDPTFQASDGMTVTFRS